MIARRSLIRSAAGSLLCVSFAGHTQPARKLYRVGMLGVGASQADMSGPQPRSAPSNALVVGMRELGYAYGEDFVTEPRSPEGQAERYPVIIAELVDLQVDVIVAPGPALAALKRATSTIPINRLVALAARYKVVAIYEFKEFAAARGLGLTIPTALLLRADRVIE